MNELDIFTFKRYVVNELTCSYDMSELEAEKAFRQSTNYKMLKKTPDFVMHYSIGDNAKEIYDEYMGIPWEM